MGQALLFAVVASSGLVIGALVGIRFAIHEGVLGVLLAFAAGALTAALAFELFDDSFEKGGLFLSSVGMASGAVVFIICSTFLERKQAGGGGLGVALFAGVVLDGIPENTALGTTLLSGEGSIALLAAIFASNFPEALVGARSMKDDGHSARRVLLIWLGAALLLAAAVVVGVLLVDRIGEKGGAGLLAFAGGAVLASLANAVYPSAFKDGGPWVAMATVLGFLVAFALGAA